MSDCPYCGAPVTDATGADLYPHRPDLHQKRFKRCVPCDAFVGCHEGTGEPFGSVANAETRRARSRAHAAFDPLWRRHATYKARQRSRSDGYAWLSECLGIPQDECHIGMMTTEQCERVVEVLRPYRVDPDREQA